MRLLPLLLAGSLGLALFPGRARSADLQMVQFDEKTLRDARVGTDGPTLLKFFRERTPEPDEVAHAATLVRELGDEAFPVRQQASQDLIKLGKAAVPHLKQAMQDGDLEISRRAEHCLEQIEKKPTAPLSMAAARLVAHRRPADAAQVLLDYLLFAEDDAVADEVRAALGTVAVRDDQPEKVLVEALADSAPVRRGAAAEALIRSQAAEPAASAARRLLQDKDPGVRLAVALALVDSRDRAGLSPLIDLLTELPAADTWRAEEILFQLAGDQAPRLTTARTDAERRKNRDAWAVWYRDHGAKLDLAQLDPAARALGLTLVVQMDNGGINGQVLEVGRDGKPRWQIKNLRYPLDAQLLPGNRVLVAEYQGNCVTERDLQGKVLWTKAVSLPISCQRLVNGNTFIVTRNQLLEVDRTGNVVFTHDRKGFDIMAARKLRDGQIVLATRTRQCIRLDATGNAVKTFPIDAMQTFSGIDVLPSGHVLVPLVSNGRVVEYDADGKIVWETKVVFPTSALRLPNGNTLITSMSNQQVLEVDRNGNKAWEYKPDGRPWRARRR